MLERLIAALRDNTPPESANPEQIWHKQVAVAALLVEASQIDRQVTESERAAVVAAITRRFGMPQGLAQQLVATAEAQFAESLDDWVFTEAVREGYGYPERMDIVGLLWEVVYADGQLSQLEDELVHRVAAQLEIAEQDLDQVRAEAFGRASGGTGGEDSARLD